MGAAATGVEEEPGDVYVAAAGDVVQRQVSPGVGQVDDRVGRYEHLGYGRDAPVADHVQRSHSCTNAAHTDAKDTEVAPFNGHDA